MKAVMKASTLFHMDIGINWLQPRTWNLDPKSGASSSLAHPGALYLLYAAATARVDIHCEH